MSTATTSFKVKCPRCGYEWERHGKLQMIKCPNCGKIFRRSE